MQLLIPLIFAGAILLVIGILALTFYCLSKGAWRRLVEIYATTNPPAGQVVQRQTVKVGAVVYNRCVRVGIADEGLYLTIYRKTILIPWNDFGRIDPTVLYWQNVPVLTVGNPPMATITVPNDLFERMRERMPVYDFVTIL